MGNNLEPLDEIKKCITDNKNFVLQGGAGSGKTEILKQTLEYLASTYPDKKIACITHTNLAVDEIKSRVGEGYTISTIHSFLNDCIKDYKKNLHEVIFELFRVDLMERGAKENYANEKEQKTEEHKKYKKIHGKYSSRLFTVQKGKTDKVEGKRDYDKVPVRYNDLLNSKIKELNSEILTQIEDKESNQIKYNDTRFNSFRDLTYGHDGLLDLSALLFERYPTIGKILQDKFDYIFIDEYQDTNEKVIDIFLNKFPNKDKTLIGLFGDSMQAIYGDGIGDVDDYIDDGILKRINKEDNYRCSEQVVKFINNLRDDKLKQEVAFKQNADGTSETIQDRQGSVEFYYSYSIAKPPSKSTPEEKQEYKGNYIKSLDYLISKSLNGEKNYRQLKLTNKSIAFDAGFEILYNVFNERFTDNKEAMDNHLAALQLTDLFEICNAYKPHSDSGLSPDYNLVLYKLKKQGVGIKKIADKKEIKNKFDTVINSELSLFETLEKSFDLKLMKKSEQYLGYLERRKTFLEEISSDAEFKIFRTLYLAGKNTLPRIKDNLPELDEPEFNELKKKVQEEVFYNDLFSDKINFQELLNYFNYQSEFTQYLTMHKTKGSGIDNVLVVLDEYFWYSEYNFRHIYSGEADDDKKWKNQKLFYVACSRAKSNLKIVRLISDEDEKTDLEAFFGNITEITSKIGILAYGSLIEDQGIELEPLISKKISDVETPFNIEVARKSGTRNDAPTVVPVEGMGAPVKAVILVLNEDVGIEDAKDLLWRRETGNVGTDKKYPNPINQTPKQVVVETISNFGGVETVLYTKIGANIDPLTPEILADLAIKSARSDAGGNGKDGISYLLSLKRQDIITPLMPEYENKILELLNVKKLEDALHAARKNI